MTPYHMRSLMTGLELNPLSTAGAGALINPHTEGTGRNVQGRREPTRTRQDGGSGYTLRRTATITAENVPTLSERSQSDSRATPNLNDTPSSGGPDVPTQRLRNEPNE